MKNISKIKFLIVFYMAVLLSLLFLVVAMPLMIKDGLRLSAKFMIEEETTESALIVVLFAASFFIFTGFRRTVKTYRKLVNEAGEEKSRLISRLSEAFSYIGTVNVELQEIRSTICGPEHYPQTKKEYKAFVHQLAVKALAITRAQWLVIRIINRVTGQTVQEYAAKSRNGALPSVTLGNRMILEGRLDEKRKVIKTQSKNIDFFVACILPGMSLSEEEIVLVMAIAYQIEIQYLLYRTGSRQHILPADHHSIESQNDHANPQ